MYQDGSGRHTERKQLTAADGTVLNGKLDLPAGHAERLVILVNGSGPNTCDNRRDKGDGTQFCFYEMLAQEFCSRGVACFRYAARGCTEGDMPPLYCTVEETAYQTYTPQNSITDLEQWIGALREDSRLRDARVVLFGMSEGAMIAPAVARRGHAALAGLLLEGYANSTMEEVLDWQQSGNSDLLFYRRYFDEDGTGVITRAAFEEDRYGVAAALGVSFDMLDQNGDGVLDLSDFAAHNAENRAAVFRAIRMRDDTWLRTHYPVRLTANWFEGHRRLPPNRETMPQLTLPLHIFQGTMDANVSVEETLAVRDAFAALGKQNLTVHLYENAGHTLDFESYLYTGVWPDGWRDIFDIAAAL